MGDCLAERTGRLLLILINSTHIHGLLQGAKINYAAVCFVLRQRTTEFRSSVRAHNTDVDNTQDGTRHGRDSARTFDATLS